MNTRWYRCGNSFSLSREVVETAVAAASDDKYYVAYCPRCRQANKIPMQQLKRSLPVGWTAPVASGAAATPEPEPTPEPVAETDAPAAVGVEANPATPAAKKASRSKAKPS